MNLPARPAWKHKRPAPRATPGAPKLLRNDDITWTRTVDPRERYRIAYIDRDGQRTVREIELLRIGNLEGTPYLGVMHQGKFKTLRLDRVPEVLEQITTGHPPSIRPLPGYGFDLPKFPREHALFKIPTIRAGSRTWTVDLNAYVCACPEKRIRLGFGYTPGKLGFVCAHMARAILENLPADAGWPEELLHFLRDPRRVHIDNLT